MKRTSKLLLLTLVLASVFAFSTGIFADETKPVTSAIVTVSLQEDSVLAEAPLVLPMALKVYSDAAESYGYADQIDSTEGVSALDVLVAFHEWFYLDKNGNDFKANHENYLVSSDEGWLSKVFGIESYDWAFAINGEGAHTGDAKADGSYDSVTINAAEVVSGDTVDFFYYKDTTPPAGSSYGNYSDKCAWFLYKNSRVTAANVAVGEEVEFTVKGYPFMSAAQYGAETLIDKILQPIANAKIVAFDLNSKEGYIVADEDENPLKTDAEGKFTLSINEKGNYIIMIVPAEGEYAFTPFLQLNAYDEKNVGMMKDLDASAWYNSYISKVMHYGVMNGTSDTEFSPNMNLTREMFVTLLHRAWNQPFVGYNNPFDDAQDSNRYSYEAICWAYEVGIINGKSNTEFAPNDNVTREEMAAMMDRFASAYGIDLSSDNPAVSFKDAAKISDWAADSVEYLTKAGILNGYPDGTFQPQGNATRAEAAKIISTFMGM